MCGITAGVSSRNIAPLLLDGLKRLEYRGYDSAGLAVLSDDEIQRIRVCGKVQALKNTLENTPCVGMVGVAHTRWATHGKPAEHNAHPILSSDHLALVHNGIIENHAALKTKLMAQGIHFTSETDTEVIAHLLAGALSEHDSLKAIKHALEKLEGAYALAILDKNHPDRIVAVRAGSPLVIGLGVNEHFIASDILALLPMTQSFVVLEEGDIAEVFRDHFQVYDKNMQPVNRAVKQVEMPHESTEKGAFRHYMQKEIFEQPKAVKDTLAQAFLEPLLHESGFDPRADEILPEVAQVHIVACGTSYHAGLVAQHWLQNTLGMPCCVEIASEMRYQRQIMPPNTLFVTLSQSGETADTLAALRTIKSNPHYLASLAICNVAESALTRESDLCFLTKAGPEIGVASTKAFLTQLAALLLLIYKISKAKKDMALFEPTLIGAINQLPEYIESTLALDEKIQAVAELFADKKSALFLGRGILYPIAKEGALKLKEISYIHAESYPAGELKHGPLALVDKDMPVVVLAADDPLLDKLRSNIQEVRARHGQLIVFACQGAEFQEEPGMTVINLPQIPALLSPLLLSIPIQLLAYHVAVFKGTDVDQPRNLAKSVTVE